MCNQSPNILYIYQNQRYQKNQHLNKLFDVYLRQSAACYQAMKKLWLHFWTALLSSIFLYSSFVLHNRNGWTSKEKSQPQLKILPEKWLIKCPQPWTRWAPSAHKSFVYIPHIETNKKRLKVIVNMSLKLLWLRCLASWSWFQWEWVQLDINVSELSELHDYNHQPASPTSKVFCQVMCGKPAGKVSQLLGSPFSYKCVTVMSVCVCASYCCSQHVIQYLIHHLL